MNKITNKKILQFCVFLISFAGVSQEYNSFEVRYQNNIKGDLTFIANSIVNRDGGTATTEPEDDYNNLSTNSNTNPETGGAFNYNDDKNMRYIDVDNDTDTFSSSTATFNFPTVNCNLIRYAGLYWSGTYPRDNASDPVGTARQHPINQIKFKVPGGAYVDITANEVLYDGLTNTALQGNSPYAAYADVSHLITPLTDPTGDYTIANIPAAQGSLPGGGSAAGWTLVIVYENPTLTGKLITTFDGFARVRGTNIVDIPYNGFNTIPVGPVKADIGAATLEGDFRISGDGMQIEAPSGSGFTPVIDILGNLNSSNFFNSDITLDGVVTTNRTPNSLNLLGYDTDMFELRNTSNSVIPNGATDATFRFRTNGDQYYPFFNSFNIEIIEPNIVLEKKVEDIGGNDITGQGVNLGQVLDYVLSFQNIGNDDATGPIPGDPNSHYTITDILPVNVTLDETNFVLPTGVTYTYTAATRTVVFDIPDNLVNKDDPIYSIRMRVKVAENCFDFVDACTDLIQNLAYSTYAGIINDNVISDDPSVTDFDDCGFVTPGATNFLLDDLSDCNFTRTVELCGSDVVLDAGNNFDSYIWVRDDNNNNTIDPTDTVLNDGDPDNDPSTMTVNAIGTYIVDKIVADPCKGFKEIINVVAYGSGTITNPIVDYFNTVNADADPNNDIAGEIVADCNDASPLPLLYLCGVNDAKLLQVNLLDTQSIAWELLDEASCTSSTVPECSNRNLTCTWNEVGTGSNYTIATPGKYRLSVVYQNGCTSRFYFNVFVNTLDIQSTKKDIVCNTLGNITITNLGAGYGYQLVDATTAAVIIPFSANNGPSFDFNPGENGGYRVEVVQLDNTGVPIVGACIFSTDEIGILDRDVQYDVNVTDASCTSLGAINIQVNNADANYEYEIRLDDGSNGGQGTLVDNETAQPDNNFTFADLNPGDYIAIARTDDGCFYSEQVTIIDTNDLELEARVSQHITCREGNIQMDSNGGQTPHTYAIWSYVDEGGTTITSYPTVGDIPPAEYQTSVIFDILAPGDYTFVVVDRDNCPAFSNTVTIEFRPAAEFNPTSITNVLCFGGSSGAIQFNLINNNGYQLTYFLYDAADTGFTTVLATNTSGYFPGLPSGDYTIRINQRRGSASCDYFENHTISTPTNALDADSALTQDYTCLQNGIIEAQNITGGTAPYEYSIDGINFVSGPGAETFPNLTNGTYTITVRDDAGCTVTTAPITIDPLNEPSDLTFLSTQPICPALVSDVTVTVVDGNTPFIYEIILPVADALNNGNNATFAGLSPGTYTFRVTDNKGCSIEESYTIDSVTPIQVTGQLISNITCISDTDGEGSFAISGFNTSYDYSITGPANFNGTGETNTTIPLTNLDDGTYTITVTDTDTNCTATADFTIAAPTAALSLSVTETQPSCTTDGSVVLTATGGWGGNNFSLNNPDGSPFGTNTTGNFAGLTQLGTYNATVTDANGCVAPVSFNLSAAIAPVLDISANDICYDDATGLTLTASVTSGGDGNYQYRINGAAYGANNVFTGLGSGTYTIDVIDGKNCTGTDTITINPELSVIASTNNIFACATSTDITITAAGGDGNFIYAVVANGIAPVVGDFGATNVINVTGAGDYDVYVRDKNGAVNYCEVSYDIAIIQDTTLTLSIANTPIACSGEAQSTITITPSGGALPYTYSIDNGANYQPSNTFVNQPAGSYNIRVRDANNCEVTQIHTITEPFTLSASAGVSELVECNPAGAEVRITNAQGGTIPYEYSFDGGSTYGPSSIANLLPGPHTLFIRDANLCTYEMMVTVDPAQTPPNLTASVDYECDGEGIITVTPDSPNFDYTYEIDGTPNVPNTSNIFNNVAIGTRTITVNYISNIVPTQSTLLLEDFGVGTNTSISEIDPAYCYEPQDGSTRPCEPGVPIRLNDGEYSVTQSLTWPFDTWLNPNDHTGNANGRFLAINVGGVAGLGGIIYAKRNIEVLSNRDITVSLEAFNLLRSTSGGADPSIEVQLVDNLGTVIASTATGNIPKNTHADDWYNYTVSLNPGAATNLDIVIRTNSTIPNGNDIAIDDIRAFQTPEICPSSVTIDVLVEDGMAFDASITNFSNVSCNAGTDGTITFEVENFDAVNGFEYAVDGGAFSAPQTSSPIVINGLSAGNVSIVVRDVLDNSCSTTIVQNITEPNAIVTSANITEEFTCNNTGATITASATGGTPTYEYQLEDNVGGIITAYQSAVTFVNLGAGNYIVRARDINGCSNPIDAAISVVAPVNPTFTATPTACYSGNNDGSIQVNVTSVPGNGGFQFSINGGPWMTPTPATATTYTFDNLSNGNYTIDVRDAFGCPGVQQPITINPQLTASAILNPDLTCLVDASVTVAALGGSGTYSYEWGNTAVGPWNTSDFAANVFTTNTDGTYFFRVTDTTIPTVCEVITNSVIVTPAQTPVITSVTPTNLNCNGDNSGALDIVIDTNFGLAPYVINVVNTTTAAVYGTQVSGLPAGNYDVTITDAKGCTDTDTAVITEPAIINYTVTSVPITCNVVGTTTNPGSISISGVTGGTAEYTYYLTANNGIPTQTYTTTSGARNHTFNILTFGIYQIDIVDANNCSSFSTEVISSPPNDLDIDVSTATADCASGGTAIVTVGAAVPSGNYEFAILETFTAPYSSTYQQPDVPGGSVATFTGTHITPGVTYTFVVFDTTSMCYYFQTAAAPINTPSNMTATLDNVANVTCTGSADGNISFTFDNYDALATSVNYEIFNSQSNITTGHSGTTNVNPPSGAISIANFATLPPGEYYLLLSEVGGPFNGCSVFGGDFTIRQSVNLLDLNVAVTKNDNCNVNAGIITANGNSGTAPYEYQFLATGSTAPTIATWAGSSANAFNTEGGTYDVYIKDANNCIQVESILLPTDPSPEISLSIVDECVAEGAFQVLVTLDQAGSEPYSLSVNGVAFQNITFDASNEYTVNGLSSGVAQTIEIRDLNGCGETENFTIQPPLQFNATLTKLIDCTVSPNAEITIDIIAGSGNYEYAITGPVNQAQIALPSDPFVWNLASTAGTYTVTVYDISTALPYCLGNIDVVVPAAILPVINSTASTAISCNGANDGTITISAVDNGTGPYTFEITSLDGAPVSINSNSNTNTSATFTGLAPSTTAAGYIVTVRGNVATNNCTINSTPILVIEPAIMAVTMDTPVEFACTAGNNQNNASISVLNTIGGSLNYVRYEFINNQGTPATGDDVVVQNGPNTTYTETNTAGGNYTINVYDDKGCIGTATATILPFDELLTATAAITNPISCNPGTDGEITITVTSTLNNLAKFEYSVDNGANYQASNVFGGLDVGTHNFLIRHVDTGCILPASETIADPDTFTISVNKTSDVVCFGSTTGEVTFELLDATYAGGFDWEIWDTNGTPINLVDDISVTSGTEAANGPTAIINVAAGSYYVSISQTNNPRCTNIEAFTIAGPSVAITASSNVTPISCIGNNGIIEITNAAGGWGGYAYYVSTTANPDSNNPANYVANPRFENLGVGTYEIWVIDQNGCPEQLPNEVLADPIPITATLQINQENCTNLQGELEVIATANGQGSNYTYQLIKDGTPFGAPQTTTIFAGLGAGSYEVQISDQWSCTTTIGPEVLYEEMNLVSTVIKEKDCTVSPDGQITITVTGGSANLEYSVVFPDLSTPIVPNNTGIFTGLNQAGTYTFTVIDLDTANPICSKSITEILVDPTPVTLDVSTIVDVSCNGLSDGSITVNLMPTSVGVNDNPAYAYNLYDATGATLLLGPVTNPTFSGLAAGFYQIEAVSGKGCASTRENVEVEEPTALVISTNATSFVCNPDNSVNTSTITVSVLDGATTPGTPSGTSPYLYSIDNINFQSTNTFTVVDNGAVQNITVYITDGNGCQATDAVVIQPLNIFTAVVSQVNDITCVGPEQVLITVTDDGNPHTYTYALMPIGNPNGTQTGIAGNTATYDLTAVGSYTFRITDTTTGCYVDTASYDIAPFDLIEVTATAITPVTCFGDNNGSLEINVTGYSGGYDYQIFDSSNNPIGGIVSTDTSVNPRPIPSLSGGNYYIRVIETDATSTLCRDDSNTVTIVSPDMPLIEVTTPLANVTCTNDQGELSVDPSGGYAPYDITLTNTTTGQIHPVVINVQATIFTGLSAGNYSVEVVDDRGCSITNAYPNILVLPTQVSANAIPLTTDLSCYGDTTGTVSAVNVINGSGSYEYQLNYYDGPGAGAVITFTTGQQASPDFTNLGPGIYSITVSDGWNCDRETNKVEITEPTVVTASLIRTDPLTCATGVEFELTAGGGRSGTYEYSTDNINWSPMTSNPMGLPETGTLGAGTHQYYVRDAVNLCEAVLSNAITEDPIDPLTLLPLTATTISCNGDNIAIIYAEATGGLGNYQYELYTNSVAPANSIVGPRSLGEFGGLTAGTYYVTVTSEDCTTAPQQIIIGEPTPLVFVSSVVNATCFGEDDGSITITPSGGSGGYIYAISPNLNKFDAENTFTNLAPGDYIIIAQDQNGCFERLEHTITAPTLLEVTGTATPEICIGSEDGSISLTITGGTAPYSTAVNSNADVDFVLDRTSFLNLAAGNYLIFVKDANDCETNIVIDVNPGVNLNAVIEPIYECTGDTPTNYVNITLEDQTILGDVLYALDSTDPNDMQLNPDFRNTAPGDHFIAIAHSNGCVLSIPFTIENFEPLTLVLEQRNLNEITATAAGGKESYQFFFDDVDNGEDNTFRIRRTDTYTVRVIDANGCEATASIFMEFIDIEIPNFFTPNGDLENAFWVPENIEAFPEILIKIFDRYGRVIDSISVNDPQGWDGSYNGKELPSGDYWYVIKLNGEEDDREFVGHFTLYR